MTEERAPRDVYTLMVEVGRAAGDGLPETCDGAHIMCYTAARSEKEAVDETVVVLRQAEMNPIEVQSYGTLAARRAEGQQISEEDLALMARAVDENAVIVAHVVPYTDEDEGARDG
ncbi:MAG: hypothetical protein AAGI34_00900 [Pseudomonadota bacterium]